uniref:Uncharacterized protein n=1 Tax=Timema poppense TaxID=170557 RepID=A0A7R9H0Q9_TIMPO|nr:unnamed protein product [Timema poppensis]
MSGDVQPRKRKDKRRKKDPQQEYVSTKMKTPRGLNTIQTARQQNARQAIKTIWKAGWVKWPTRLGLTARQAHA